MANLPILPEGQRWVPGYEGAYSAHPNGKVFSWKGKGGAREIGGVGRHGRVSVCLSMGGKRWQAARSAVILTAFVGPRPTIPGKMVDACHNNGDCTDDRLENLRWDTRQANILDAVRHNIKNISWKILPAQRDQIVSLYARGGSTQAEIAAIYGVSQATVSHITTGVTHT